MSSVTRNIVLTADGSKALSTINQVDGRIAAMSSPTGSLGKLASLLKFAGVAAAVTTTFGVITKNVLKFSGELDKVDAKVKMLFKDKNEVLSATNKLMQAYDYTKIQTQQYLTSMAMRIRDVVTEKNLLKASTGAITVAQRISSTTGKSLEEAMNEVARAMHGHLQGLEREGLAINRTVKGSLNILQMLEDATIGSEQVIEAEKNTIEWQLGNLKKSIESSWIKIAQTVDAILGPAIRKILELIGSLNFSVPTEQIQSIKSFFDAFTANLDQLKEPLQILTEAFGKLNDALMKPITAVTDKVANIDEVMEVLEEMLQSLSLIVTAVADVVELWTKINFGTGSLIGPLTTIKWVLRGVNALLGFARLGFKTLAAGIGFVIDIFAGVISAIKSFSLSKLKEAWSMATEGFSNSVANAYLDLDKQMEDLKTKVAKDFNKEAGNIELKVDKSKFPKEIKLEVPAVNSQEATKAVQQGVNQVFEQITAPVDKVQTVVKVANELNLKPMTEQVQLATTSVNTFTEALKKLDLTQTIETSLQKMKANIETSLNDIGNIQLMAKAGEMMNAAAIAFQSAVNVFNSQPQQAELVKEAKQTNSYLERISRNLIGVDVFA